MYVAAGHVLAASSAIRAHLAHGLIALGFLVVAVTAGVIADARQKRAGRGR